MIILRKKYFSENNSSNEVESDESGWSYYPAQYIAEPLDHTLDYLETSKIGELKPVKKKSRMVRNITKWLKSKKKEEVQEKSHKNKSKKK